MQNEHEYETHIVVPSLGQAIREEEVKMPLKYCILNTSVYFLLLAINKLPFEGVRRALKEQSQKLDEIVIVDMRDA